MNLRKEVRKANLAKWQKQGPAVIRRPLRKIHEKCPDVRREDGTFDHLDPSYAFALWAAKRGDGQEVKKVARSLI